MPPVLDPPSPPPWSLRVLLTTQGALAPGVLWRVVVLMVAAVAAVGLDRRGVPVRLPIALHEVGGAVIALALSFRVNSAYARYWEGRTAWGALVNASRNLARALRVYAPGEAADDAPMIALFAHALRVKLRRESVAGDARRLLRDPAQAAAIKASPHAPLALAEALGQRIAAALRTGQLTPEMASQCERYLGAMVDSLGAIERVASTPTPPGFSLLIERFLALHLISLPFALVAEVGLWTPAVLLAVAYPVLMIDAIGQELEDPFGTDRNDLRLEAISATIERTTAPPAPWPASQDSPAIPPR